MAVPKNKELYAKIKKEAKKKFIKYPSIYANSWVVREYKKRGGQYIGSKPRSTGLKRWYKEKWVDLNRPIKKNGKIVGYKSCGRNSVRKSKEKYPLCRPTYVVTKKTPKTYKEISKRSISKAKKQKSKIRNRGNIQFGGGECMTKLNSYKDKFMTKAEKYLKNEDTKTRNDILKRTENKLEKKINYYIDNNQIGGGVLSKFKEYGKEKLKKIKEQSESELKKISPKELLNKVEIKMDQKIQELKGGGKAQYYGRQSDVMVPVPKNVKKWAVYAFKLKDLGFKGATKTGWKRARQLATQDFIPIEDLKYMHAWYSRHIYTSYPGFQEWINAGRPKTKEWQNKRSIIAIVTWGGPAALRWLNSKKIMDLLSKHYDKEIREIKKRHS